MLNSSKLKKLDKKLDNILENETEESMSKFIKNKNMITAEEMLTIQEDIYSNLSGTPVKISDEGGRRQLIIETMVKFTKHHVKLALKEALDSIPCLGSSSDIATYYEVEEAVLNSYPLENIK